MSNKVSKKKQIAETIVIAIVIICLGLIVLELLTNIHNNNHINFIQLLIQ